jgi:hypothetical protein
MIVDRDRVCFDASNWGYAPSRKGEVLKREAHRMVGEEDEFRCHEDRGPDQGC